MDCLSEELFVLALEYYACSKAVEKDDITDEESFAESLDMTVEQLHTEQAIVEEEDREYFSALLPLLEKVSSPREFRKKLKEHVTTCPGRCQKRYLAFVGKDASELQQNIVHAHVANNIPMTEPPDLGELIDYANHDHLNLPF